MWIPLYSPSRILRISSQSSTFIFTFHKGSQHSQRIDGRSGVKGEEGIFRSQSSSESRKLVLMASFSSILRQATPTVVGRARGRMPSDGARKLHAVQTTTRAVVSRAISRGNVPANVATKVAAREDVLVRKDVRVPIDVAPKRPARVNVSVHKDVRVAADVAPKRPARVNHVSVRKDVRVPANVAPKRPARVNVSVDVIRAPKEVVQPARVNVPVDVASAPKEVVRPSRVNVTVNVARAPKKAVQLARVKLPVDVARAPKEVVQPSRVNMPVNVARAPKKVVQPARVNEPLDVARATKEVVRPLRVNVPAAVARAPKEVVRPVDVAPVVRPARVNVPLDRKDVVGPARGKMPVRKEVLRPASVNVPKDVVRVPADVTSMRPVRGNGAADVSRKGVLQPGRGNMPAHDAHKSTVRQARGNGPAHGAKKGVTQEKTIWKTILSNVHNQLKDCSKLGRRETDAPIQDNAAPNNVLKCQEKFPLLVQAVSSSGSAENTRTDKKSRREAEPKPRLQAKSKHDDYGDPQMCEAYSSDIYEYVHSLEKEYQRRPLPDYIGAVQTDITANMRAQVVAWLVDVSEEFKLVPDTLFLSVSYFDRFLSLQPLGPQRLQLLGATCMFVASKYEEISRLHVDAFCYKKKEIVKMEESILHILKFELGDVTINTFLRRLIRFAPAGPNPPTLQFEYLCNFLSELSLIDYDCVKFVPSQIAASVVFVVKFTLNPDAHPWNLPMQNFSGYKPSDLKACVLAIHDLQHDRKWEPISKAAKTKYNQQSYQFASTLLSPVVIPSKYFEDPK